MADNNTKIDQAIEYYRKTHQIQKELDKAYQELNGIVQTFSNEENNAYMKALIIENKDSTDKFIAEEMGRVSLNPGKIP